MSVQKHKDLDDSIAGVITTLKKIDDGVPDVYSDFTTTEDVNCFCTQAGLSHWGGIVVEKIASETTANGPSVVPKEEAWTILKILKQEITKNTFRPKGGGEFDKTVLDDFLPKNGSLEQLDKDRLWEFQYALAVELEHGRTRGTNVTNNHPLLTGMIVMAHLTETTLYYARLWVMEVQGEIFEQLRRGSDVSALRKELKAANAHLKMRKREKV